MQKMIKPALFAAALLLAAAPAAHAAQGVGTGNAASGTSNGNSASANSNASTTGTGGSTDETGRNGSSMGQMPAGSGTSGSAAAPR